MTSRELPLHREASNRRNISIGSVSPWRRQQRGIRASPRPRVDKNDEKIRATSSSSPLGEMDNKNNNNNHSTTAVVIKNNNHHAGGSPLKSLRRRLDQFRRNHNKQKQQQVPNEICFVPHCKNNSSSSSLLFVWLSECCPADVVALVLAYSGPQTVAVLSRVNRHWNQLVHTEETWRVLCEELYKWKPDVDEIPKSWKDYYRRNPCVPVDYPSIDRALEAAWNNHYHHQRDAHADAFVVRILVRPGRYELDQPLQIPAASQHAKMMMSLPPPQITIEKLQLPQNHLHAASFGHGNPRRRCWRWEETEVVLQSSSSLSSLSRHNNINQPLLFITNGMWTLKQIRLHHGSAGMDIWRGNAALHIEPSFAPHHGDSAPTATTTTTTTTTTCVVLEQCEVTSTSGRGIVLSSSRQQQQPGSSSSSDSTSTGTSTRLQLRDCVVHGCAATGIYVGHDQAVVQVVQTDVIGNGMGNHQYLRRGSLASLHHGGLTGAGIARGHSGIYLERGRRVELLDSNISENSSSGIGVTHSRELFLDSTTNNNDRLLSISGCDLIGNGSLPLDVRQQDNNHNHHHHHAADNTITDPHAMAQFWEQQQINNSNHTLLHDDDDHHQSLSLSSEQQQQHDNNSTNRLSDVAGSMTPRPRSSLEMIHLHDESDFSSRDEDHDEDTLEEEEFEEYIGV